MLQLPPPHDQDVVPAIENQTGGLVMITWSRARNAAIFVATAVAAGVANISAASAEIIPLVTIAMS